MQRISGAQLRDIRGMKKHNTYGPISSHSEIRRPPLTTVERNDPRFIINDELHEVPFRLTSEAYEDQDL